MKSYAFLTEKEFEVYKMQKELQLIIPSVSSLTYSRTSTPYVLYVYTNGELAQEEITLIEQKVK